MTFEKRWAAVSPQPLIANGTSAGSATLADTRPFKVKQQVVLTATSLPDLPLEIKQIDSKTVMWLGPIGGNIKTRTDISLYTTALSSAIYASEQSRSNVPEQEIERLAYEEEPTVAHRTVLVDPWGNKIATDNPLPVQLTDGSINIETLNAELRVQLSAKDNDPKAGDVHSSVRIGDGQDELGVNPDGSLNITNLGTSLNIFNQVSSVTANAYTAITTYTVPPVNTVELYRVEVGGDNIATYEVYINSSIQGRVRTWFGTPLTQNIEFTTGVSGHKLNTGDVIVVNVVHTRPDAGDFEARIQLRLL